MNDFLGWNYGLTINPVISWLWFFSVPSFWWRTKWCTTRVSGLLLSRLLWKFQSFCASSHSNLLYKVLLSVASLHMFVCVHAAYICYFAHMHACHFIYSCYQQGTCAILLSMWLVYPHQYISILKECYVSPLHHPNQYIKVASDSESYAYSIFYGFFFLPFFGQSSWCMVMQW